MWSPSFQVLAQFVQNMEILQQKHPCRTLPSMYASLLARLGRLVPSMVTLYGDRDIEQQISAFAFPVFCKLL